MVNRKRMLWVIWGAGMALLTLLLLSRTLWPAAGEAISGHDVRGQFYPWAEYARQQLHSGDLPWWDPFQHGGYPMVANPQIGFFYPPAWLALLISPRFGWGAYLTLHLWWAGLGMGWFMRRRGAGGVGLALAMLTYAFGGFMAARLQAGHVGMIATAAWLPWVLATYDWSLERDRPWAAMLAGLPWGLALLAGNLNLAFYMGVIWLAYAAHRGATTGRWWPILRQLALAGTTGLALSAVQMIPLAELLWRTTRTAGTLEAYGSRWSLPPFHLLALWIPGYFGVPGITGWWSVDNFEELTYYAGALPWLVLPWAWRHKSSRWYLVLAIGGLLLALGTYSMLYPLLYDLLPFFRLGRAPARAAFLFTFAASAWLGEAVSAWSSRSAEERRAALPGLSRWWRGGLLAGVLGLAATGAVFAIVHPSEQGGRLWHQASGWAWWLALWAGSGALVWVSARAGRPRWRRGALWALVAVALLDLWSLAYPLVGTQSVAVAPLWQDASALIGETEAMVLPWGVNLEAQNDAGRVGLRSALGYNPLELAAYAAFANSVPDPRSTAYDVLGVGYVIAPGEVEARFLEGAQGLQAVGHTAHVWVYRRPSALPVARLVYQAEVIADPAAAIARVHQAGLVPATTAILAQAPPCALEPGTGTARILSATPGRWVIETNSTSPALLLLAENAYPGWRVTVDGEAALALTTYTTLRATCVPAGAHTVTWVFRPRWLGLGAAVSALTVVIMAWGAWQVWRHRPALSM